MKILFLSSEVAPFSRTGGLGDVAGALPKALKNRGHEVRVITPRYRSVRERKYNLREVSRLKSLEIHIGGKDYKCSVKSGFIPQSKVQVYFIENEQLFDRDGFYVNPETGDDWPDNHLRFVFLAHAALQLIQHLQWFPDIIHCNDWQTALIPYLVRQDDRYQSDFDGARTVLQLHNVAYQGLFALEKGSEICFNSDHLKPGAPLEFFGKINFLKGGASLADMLVTVSPTYAREIQTIPDIGAGLESLFTRRSDRLVGVLNGVDTTIWSPSNDPLIPRPFTLADYQEGKRVNKLALQKKLGLKINPDIPVVGMTTRLVEQKGLDLMLAAEPELLALPVQWAVLGIGERRYEEMLTGWAKAHPDRIAVTLDFNDELAHLIEAGADLFLMPSRFEPCGLNQMYSLLYGTVPVVRVTGGLADTVTDWNRDPAQGNGFTFIPYTGAAMVDALQRALNVFSTPDQWRTIQERGLAMDFSWERAANRYDELYRELLSHDVAQRS